MTSAEHEKLHAWLSSSQNKLLETWLEQFGAESERAVSAIRGDASALLDFVVESTRSDDEPTSGDALAAIADLARARVAEGYSADETTLLLGTLRRTLLRGIAEREDVDGMLWLSKLLDRIVQRLMEAYVVARDEVIARQQEDLLELSTPTIQLWEGIVALPLVGTLDSRRAVVVMESLLNKIAATRSEIAIVDVTGVPMVDTLVAQHLIKTVTAARLTGAHCILCGIRPQIAQTMVELGIGLDDIDTRSNLSAAFAYALQLRGLSVSPT